MQDALASELLRQAGYANESCARCVAQLIRRFRESGEFPHEVGLWKVYGNEEKARSLFAKYKKCTEIYCALWQSGSRLEQLAVAV